MTCIPTCLTHGRQCKDIAKVEALEAEIEKLREALTKISLRKWNSMTQGCNAAREANDIARAALGETK
jgi:hypothetical protein